MTCFYIHPADLNISKIFNESYSQLVQLLPMKDPIFVDHLKRLYPDNVMKRVNGRPTRAEGATFLLDNVIKPAIQSGNNKPFKNLLSVTKEYDNLKNLTEKIEKDIQSKY